MSLREVQMSTPAEPRPPFRRKRTLVDLRRQWRFALEVLAAQAMGVLAYLAALQLRIVDQLRITESAEVEHALREVFRQGLVTLLVVGPVLALLVILLGLRLSHTMVGPVPRLREGLRALTEGRTSTRLRFRPTDVLSGVDDDFNALAESLERRWPDEATHVVAAVQQVASEEIGAARDAG